MFDGLVDILFGWFFELLYILQMSISVVVDFIIDIFYMLSGIETVTIAGQESDLLSHFLFSNGVRTAFLGVLLVGIILLCIFTIVAIIRSEYAEGNQKKTKGQILTRAGQAFVIFLIIPFLLAAGIMLTNIVMGAIHGSMLITATEGGRPLFGGQILVTSGSGAFRGNPADQARIEQMFITGQLDYRDISVVSRYYNFRSMNFFVGIGSSLVLLVLFALAAIRFVQRLFDVVLLYIVSPVSVATIPADDGQRFKLWREMLVSKVLSAYGIILSMNLFFLIIPQVMRITFFQSSFQNGVVGLLFMIGGAFAVLKANMVIAQLTGNNAGAQEAQQMLAGIYAGARMGRAVYSGGAAAVGQVIGGSDFVKNQKKGMGFGDNINTTINSNRNQRVTNNNKGKDGQKKKLTAGQTTARVAGGVGRLATLPVGMLKDLMQGGVITAGKNAWPRLRNIATGRGVCNRAAVTRKSAANAEKITETETEKTDTTTTTHDGSNAATPPPTV